MIGLIARSDNTGLGIQTHEFFKHIHPDKTLVVDVSNLNKLKQHPYRYPKCKIVNEKMNLKDINEFLEGLKVIFCCETPYNYEMFRIARRKGIKIILQYNYEFLEMKSLRDVYYPDVFAAPSQWHIEDIKKQFKNVIHLPVPVNRELLPFSEKKKFKRFLHIVGNSAEHDRNGTAAAIEAFKQTGRTDIELVVKCFNKSAAEKWSMHSSKNITIDSNNTTNYEHNYIGFDAMILPRKYGGLCLPMQEALSCGMPVIMTDISPNNGVLPSEWLVPVDMQFTFESKYTITVNEPNVPAITDKINWLSDLEEIEARTVSTHANNLAADLDWEVLKKKYMDILNS